MKLTLFKTNNRPSGDPALPEALGKGEYKSARFPTSQLLVFRVIGSISGTSYLNYFKNNREHIPFTSHSLNMFATTSFSKPVSFSRFQRFFLVVALIFSGIVLLYKFGPRGWLLPTSVSKATLRLTKSRALNSSKSNSKPSYQPRELWPGSSDGMKCLLRGVATLA